MNTILKDWYIVSVFEGKELLGKILWGICVDDMTYRFAIGDYVCTSKIEFISPMTHLIRTVNGSLYQVIGEGRKVEVQVKNFELLRKGFSPDQITQLNLISHDLLH